ncbi:MAG: hypothetical protein ABJX94_00515 [Flavobacteriaceae bacterium]
MTIKHYVTKTDWTNAFGDGEQSKSELKKFLALIFKMDLVMSG